jgi:hypothetical protein
MKKTHFFGKVKHTANFICCSRHDSSLLPDFYVLPFEVALVLVDGEEGTLPVL